MKKSLTDTKKNLIKVMFKKERIHWLRMRLLYFDMENFGERFISFPLLVILVSAFHYAFAGMHFAFEGSLYFFKKERYKVNVVNLYDKSNKKLTEFRSLVATKAARATK